MHDELGAKVDLVTLEVIRNALPAITNEMSLDLQRTSYNMMIYEVRDYCCALIDVDGQLLAQNVGGVSHFVADLGTLIKDGVAQHGRDGFAPGDVVITNHQKVGGQHLNNVCIYTPFFFQDELIGFAVVRAHWVDIGGMSTGFGAGGVVSDPWMEGLQLDQIKLYEKGLPDQKALKLIKDNVRFSENAMGDLRSQVAACNLAERRLDELFTRYGRDVVLSSINTIFDQTEAKCRTVVERIPDGEYWAESVYDHDGVEKEKPVEIKVRVAVKGGDMIIDLTESSPQRLGAINSRTLAGAYVAYKGVTTPREPVNEGSFRALDVRIQEGNLMMATFPAPMAGWSSPIPTVVDTVLTALAPAMPDFIPAAHLGTLGSPIQFFGIDPKRQKGFVVQSIEGGGWGGRSWEDGESGTVSVCQGDVRNGPIENIELKCPVLIESRGFRKDSGGPGKFRGGLGVETKLRNLVEGRWNMGHPGRSLCPPWGLWGGRSGASPSHMLKVAGEDEFREMDAYQYRVPVGSIGAVLSGGGGGWGDPLERSPEHVRQDVVEEFVSREAAFNDYGVVFEEDSYEVDLQATAARREELFAERQSLVDSARTG